MVVVVVTGEAKSLNARFEAGICRSTTTLVALLNDPNTVPNWAVPVASDINVTNLPPKSAIPPKGMLNVLPGLTVRVAVPLRVREPVRFKSMFNNGVPEEMVILSAPEGTVPLHQFDALFHSFEMLPVQLLA